ncbi:hypothetical protein M5K25_016252 [Dendrobium thyrsiflorum]|uniref:Uncharacterized protein n=1 Tax=Dendrobium thyrsiflorum TaxID=117978 RepID=A0ABD0UJ53_DENTH
MVSLRSRIVPYKYHTIPGLVLCAPSFVEMTFLLNSVKYLAAEYESVPLIFKAIFWDPNHGFAAVDVLVNCEAKLGFLFDPASLPLSTIRFVALLFVLLPLSR